MFRKSILSFAVSAAVTFPVCSLASQTNSIEHIEITSSHRVATIQETPFSIYALESQTLKEHNIDDLTDISRWVAGLTVPQQGGTYNPSLIIRGLNTNSSEARSDGGTVATYIGDVPLTVDMKLIDVKRVEVLLGPQGTLYGEGSLAGAIRYIPNEAMLDESTISVYGDVSTVNESDDIGKEIGGVFNFPIIDDSLALRVALNHEYSPGYIDYNYTVKEAGVSLTDPDWLNQSEVDDNIKRVSDVNSIETTTARVMLRWLPHEKVDTTLSYFYQNEEIGGQSIVHYNTIGEDNALFGLIGKYESAHRFVEPVDRDTSLVSLSVVADLGFAEFTSATGYAQNDITSINDQTDLQMRIELGYEEFPSFVSYADSFEKEDTFSQELRLVSTIDAPYSWIVGAFYKKAEYETQSKEINPKVDQYAIDNWGAVQLRPDAIDYLGVSDGETTQSSIFGEFSYQATDKLTLTIGGRYYDYDIETRSAYDLPITFTIFDPDADPELIYLEYEGTQASDNGSIFKFNIAYELSKDILLYSTVSEGFRIGGSNDLTLCDGSQDVCAQPNEMLYSPDTTTNYEIGVKTALLDNSLMLNATAFLTKWDDAQLNGASQVGQTPIITNAGEAQTSGVELSVRAMLTDDLQVIASYAYTKAELTQDSPSFFQTLYQYQVDAGVEQSFYDGKDGDRLPSTPKQQLSVGVKYTQDVLTDKTLDINFGLTYQSEMYTKVGLRADGEILPGYALSNLSATLTSDEWSVTLYADNLFDKYAYSATRRNKGDIGLATYPEMNINDPMLQRNYGHYLITPRTVGLKFDYSFEL
jgi:outer membrane receptor protein involved in Fe transport